MAELWDILDENGNAAGRLHQRGKPINEGDYRISQRSPIKAHPHLWKWSGISPGAAAGTVTVWPIFGCSDKM